MATYKMPRRACRARCAYRVERDANRLVSTRLTRRRPTTTATISIDTVPRYVLRLGTEAMTTSIRCIPALLRNEFRGLQCTAACDVRAPFWLRSCRGRCRRLSTLPERFLQDHRFHHHQGWSRLEHGCDCAADGLRFQRGQCRYRAIDALGHYSVNDLRPEIISSRQRRVWTQYVQQVWEHIDCPVACAATTGTAIRWRRAPR
jgi:hypothetical protein